MNSRSFTTMVCATSLAALAACSSTPRQGDAYQSSAYPSNSPVYTQPGGYAQAPAYAAYGTVRSIEVVPMQAHTSGGGAVLGAVLGAVVGNQIGSGTGRAAATAAGAVGGAVAGNAIENRNRRDDEVYRVWVRMDNGGLRSFDFYRIDDLRVGDRVRYDGGQLYRY